MVSRLTVGPSFRFATSSAINRTLHRARPSGGGPQTMATVRCFCPVLNTRSWPGRGFSYRAVSSPLPRSAGRWRAPSSALRLRSRPPAPPSAHRRAGANWKPAAALAPTPVSSAASRQSAVHPSCATQHAHGDNFACSNYESLLDSRKVSIKVHLHIVGDLVACRSEFVTTDAAPWI